MKMTREADGKLFINGVQVICIFFLEPSEKHIIEKEKSYKSHINKLKQLLLLDDHYEPHWNLLIENVAQIDHGKDNEMGTKKISIVAIEPY